MSRRRTGSLVLTKGGYHCRVTIGANRKRKFYALGTADEAEARRRLDDILAEDRGDPDTAAERTVDLVFNPGEWRRIRQAAEENNMSPNAFAHTAVLAQAARKFVILGAPVQMADISKIGHLTNRDSSAQIPHAPALMTYAAAAKVSLSQLRERGLANHAKERESLERRIILPAIGERDVATLTEQDVANILADMRASGKSDSNQRKVLSAIHAVLSQLWKDFVIPTNPAGRLTVGAIPKERRKQTELTPEEWALYLAWTPEDDRRRPARIERRAMVRLAREHGLRVSQIHSLKWDHIDLRLLNALREWSELMMDPPRGYVFPVSKVGKLGDRSGERRMNSSPALAFKRDLQAAFIAAVGAPGAPEPMSKRWRELFSGSRERCPVSFNSIRQPVIPLEKAS